MQSLWDNRHAVRSALQGAPVYPQLIEYGHQYSITLLGPAGEAVTAVFSYNTNNYASEGDTDAALDRLVTKLVPESVYAELVSYSLTSMIGFGHEQNANSHIRIDNGHFLVPGSQIRYRTKEMRSGNWKHLSDDYSLTINPIRQWVDPNVDAKNEILVRQWILDTRKRINTALTHLDAFEKEFGSAE